MKKTLLAVALGAAMLAPAVAGTLVDLSAEASLPAANDLVRAVLYSEAGGGNPGELSRRVNGDVAEALKAARGAPGVSVKSGQQHTWPVYAQGTRVESWRMRSEIVIESKDQAAVSELVGKLQQMRLAVASMALMPSPETRRRIGDEAIREAISAFRQRAELVARQFDKPWKIKQMSVTQAGDQPVPVLHAARGVAMLASAPAPAPLEAGDTLVTASVSGQIELAD